MLASIIHIVLAACAATTVASDTGPPTSLPPPKNGMIAIEYEYIVVLDENVMDAAGSLRDLIAATARAHPTPEVETISSVWNINDAFKGQGVRMSRVQAEFMSLLEDVKYIEPNMEEWIDNELPPQDTVPPGDDTPGEIDETTTTALAWGMDRVDQRNLPLDGEYTYDYTGAGVVAYIMDGGIRATHEDIRDNMSPDVPNPPFANEYDDDACLMHGTHIAGTIGGRKYGLAKDVTMVDVRFLNCATNATPITTTTRNRIEAYAWIADHAARDGRRGVVNASWGRNVTVNPGGPNATPGGEAIAALVGSGVVFVANSGNSGNREGDTCTRLPGGLDSTIAVGATNSTDHVAGFSNYGRCVDVLAPGVGILSAGSGSDTEEKILSGTSFAAPHVVAAVALILEQYPNISPEDVRARLISRSTKNAIKGDLREAPNRLLYTLALDSEITPSPITPKPTTKSPISSPDPTGKPTTDAPTNRTPSPTGKPTTNPTTKPTTKRPSSTPSLTGKPTSGSTSSAPTPTGKQPTAEPTPRPVTKQPISPVQTPKPVTEQPTPMPASRGPTPKPITKQPTPVPQLTMQPSKSPSNKPTTKQPVAKSTTKASKSMSKSTSKGNTGKKQKAGPKSSKSREKLSSKGDKLMPESVSKSAWGGEWSTSKGNQKQVRH